MFGPAVRLRLTFGTLSISVFDSILCLMVLAGTIDWASGHQQSAVWITVASGLAGTIFLGVALAAELCRLRLSGHANPLETIAIGITGGTSVSIEESRESGEAVRGGLVGAGIDFLLLAAGSITVLGSWRHESLLTGTVLATGLVIGASATLRLFPAGGVDGGRILFWYFNQLLDDEDSASTGVATYGVIVSLVVMVGGIGIALGVKGLEVWGIGLLGSGFALLTLGPAYRRQVAWLGRALNKPLKDVLHSSLPVMRTNSPLSELLAISSVEGARTLVVVTDERNQPVGVIQLDRLYRASRLQGRNRVEEFMMQLADIPHLPPELSVLEARLELERSGQRAAVYESGDGKTRVISLDELRAI